MRWLIFASLLLLAGCNTVTTRQAMFPAPGFAPVDLVLRPGIWSWCDARRPVGRRTQGSCSFLVTPDGVRLEGGDGELWDHSWRPSAFGVSPLIVQVPEYPSGAPPSPADDQHVPPTGFSYFAAEVIQRDEHGDATVIRAWPVQCGPVSRRPDSHGRTYLFTRRPFPGITFPADEGGCTATSPTALSNAATLSRALFPEWLLRWTRDPGPSYPVSP